MNNNCVRFNLPQDQNSTILAVIETQRRLEAILDGVKEDDDWFKVCESLVDEVLLATPTATATADIPNSKLHQSGGEASRL